MMPLGVFDVVKRRGKLRVLDTLRYEALVATVGEGELLDLTLSTPEQGRTLRQNAYLHAEPVKKLCQAEGYTPAQAKLVLLGEFFGWTRLPSGQFVPVKASTSELTRDEMRALIDWCPVFGAEHGYDIHPPEPAARSVST